MFKLKSLLIIISSILFLSSCDIQKKVYNKGYHIDWFVKDYQYPHSKQTIAQQIKQQVFDSTNQNIKHSNTIRLQKTEELLSITGINNPDSFHNCDIIFLLNGEEIDAIVTEVDIDVVKYKRCINPNGPVYTMFKSDIMMIRYKNGTKDIFIPSHTPTPAPPRQDEFSRQTPTVTQSSSSSQVVENPRESNPLAVIGFMLSLISLVIPFPALLLTSLTSIVFGLASLHSDYPALAVLAIILGIIVLLFGLAVLAAV
jgi:hypothetical protein